MKPTLSSAEQELRQQQLRLQQRAAAHAQLDQLLDQMDTVPNHDLLGPGEFKLRDLGQQLLRQVLEQQLEARKKGGT